MTDKTPFKIKEHNLTPLYSCVLDDIFNKNTSHFQSLFGDTNIPITSTACKHALEELLWKVLPNAYLYDSDEVTETSSYEVNKDRIKKLIDNIISHITLSRHEPTIIVQSALPHRKAKALKLTEYGKEQTIQYKQKIMERFNCDNWKCLFEQSLEDFVSVLKENEENTTFGKTKTFIEKERTIQHNETTRNMASHVNHVLTMFIDEGVDLYEKNKREHINKRFNSTKIRKNILSYFNNKAFIGNTTESTALEVIHLIDNYKCFDGAYELSKTTRNKQGIREHVRDMILPTNIILGDPIIHKMLANFHIAYNPFTKEIEINETACLKYDENILNMIKDFKLKEEYGEDEYYFERNKKFEILYKIFLEKC